MEISTLSDKFSWRRMFAFGMIFKNSMRVYLVVSALTSLVCYLLVQLTIYLGGNEIGIYTLLSFIVGLTLYLSPLTFARRDDTLLALIPAKPVEKWLVYILYSLIAVPLVVEGVWYSLEFIFWILNSGYTIQDIMWARVKLDSDMMDLPERSLIIALSLVQSYAIIATVLYVVLKAVRNRVVKGLLGLLGILFATSILAAIIGGTVAYFNISADPKMIDNPAVLIKNMISVFGIIYVLLAVYSIILTVMIYRHVKAGEIKA
ncbi:hypothetical protein [Duncaniella muris]|jgi:hypothetical protein|uniref:hypothetical protein n=2 Tax=Duncaniella TaxID=2518495 RepID=UPI000F49B6CC|nr:hypothetical protein [Duncaniella muris]ROS90244.1 hypothetical protein EEL39_00245 [Muribaculaceae bacterium Isolate-080 (Janvier)]